MQHLSKFGYLLALAAITLIPARSVGADIEAGEKPTRAYQKCVQSLEKSAAVHRERTSKARAKHERKVTQFLNKSVDPSSLEKAIERIRIWRDVEQAENTYIDKIIGDIDELISPDGPAFTCLDRGRLLKVYQGNESAYAEVLEQVEKDIEQRLDIESLGPDEGLVIISYDATEPLTYVRINRRHTLGGNIEFSPLRAGQYYRVLKAKAGTYSWDHASRDMGSYRRDYDLGRFDLTFTVKPGVINYAGTFQIEMDRRRYYSVAVNDRLVIALHMLESRYPDLMWNYEIVNGLFPDDRFVEFYLREISLLREEASVGAE